MNSDGVVQVENKIKLEMIITFSYLTDDSHHNSSSSSSKRRTSSGTCSSSIQQSEIQECVSTGPVSPLKISGVYWFKCLKPYTAGKYVMT